MKEKRVVVVGGMNMDLVCKAEVAPRPGETVVGESFYKGLGGKGANQAIVVARLGVPVSFIGRVGDDEFGQEMLAAMRANGVGTEHMKVTQGCSSGIALIIVDAKAQNQIVVIPGANAKVTPDDITDAEETIARASLVVAQFETSIKTLEKTLAVTTKYGVPVILNPAPVINERIDPALLRQVEILVPNETEAESLTGVRHGGPDFANVAAEAFRKMGVQRAIITLGEAGSLLATEKKITHIPAFEVTPVDTTAAGDAFVGALAAGYFFFDELELMVKFASAAGALAVTKKGSQASLPTRQELEVFLRCHSPELLDVFRRPGK
ncbi:MAG: ribokinase [Candidatus Abyssubacteria bacterium]